MSYLYDQKPIEWSEFMKLMEAMNKDIKGADDISSIRLARKQTSIALGAFLGLRAKELLFTRWSEVANHIYYKFKFEARPRIKLDLYLKKMIRKNWILINPLKFGYILPDPFDASSPITPLKFNNILHQLFAKYDISTPAPTTLTLRKTYALKVWQENGFSDQMLKNLSEELGYDLATMKLFVKK